MERFSMDGFTRTFSSQIEAPVRSHLKNVYGCLSMSTLSAALGGYLYLSTELFASPIMAALGTLGFLVALLATPDAGGKNRQKRLGFLLAFAFCTGIGLGPLVEMSLVLNPSLVPTAFLATSVVFVCFSASALLSPRGQMLALGGPLLSLLSMLALASLANLFIRSQALFQAHLYLGLAAMCGFILFDTQLIVEKRRAGDKDFVAHSLDLFIDFVSVFRHLLVILSQKESQKKNRKN